MENVVVTLYNVKTSEGLNSLKEGDSKFLLV